MRLWTGCIVGALLDADYLRRLKAAGFTDPTVQITRTYTDEDLLEMARTLPAGSLPDGNTAEEAVASLAGVFASAFIRADKA